MQEFIVGIIVVFAFWLVAKRYTPPAIQRFLRKGFAGIAKQFGWPMIAQRFETEKPAPPSCSDGCSACRQCGPSGKVSASKKTNISSTSIERSTPPL
ncbi:MAG: hypothetical protein HHJ16_06390 [Polaromonas sp.]|uniref:DUF6587 family protein n=1 Tax=Polaromonas sp. TaxID=1869339 RepID=UPI00178E46E6|nr:DUF6587 family protein [Polaromonas sp.]NMM09884.1 hypothetical protein [Polaromonas sp.]